LGSLDRTLGEVRDDVDLLVSELITNSVIHAKADRVELRASADADGVRIEVSDPGPGFDRDRARREPSLTGEGGYGLNIVDKLCDRWGVNRDGDALVWLEIDRPSGRRGRFSGATAADTGFRELTAS
jgi:anti-sigma regulatory factor (Ser/Thr protein kinase)